MRVLLEASAQVAAGSRRGLGRYVAELRTVLHGSGWEVLEYARPSRRNARIADFTDFAMRQAHAAFGDYDLYHCGTPLQMVAWARGRPIVASVLDVAPLDVPGYQRTGVKLRAMYRLVRNADHVLTLSDFSAARIGERLGISPERITVAPLPVPAAFTSATPCIGPDCLSQYVLVVSPTDVSDPRKRVHWLGPLADALQGHGIRTVVVGAGTDRRCSLPEGCHGLGHVSDASLKGLLQHAIALVVISAYEGQGLPALEAMSVGLPVVGMRNSATEEVVSNAGVLIPEPFNDSWLQPQTEIPARTVREIADAVLRLRDLPAVRSEMSAACIARASEYSRERFRSGVLSSYESAVFV